VFICGSNKVRFLFPPYTDVSHRRHKMNNRLATLGIGFLAMTAIGIPTLMVATAVAQNPPAAGPQGGGVARPGQGPGFPPQGAPGQPGQFRPMGPMGGGGGSISAGEGAVYVLQGNRVFKLDRNSLKVIAEGQLPMPQMGQPGAPGQPERTRGGNVPPPPPPPEK
jgi:hypothetical protein